MARFLPQLGEQTGEWLFDELKRARSEDHVETITLTKLGREFEMGSLPLSSHFFAGHHDSRNVADYPAQISWIEKVFPECVVGCAKIPSEIEEAAILCQERCEPVQNRVIAGIHHIEPVDVELATLQIIPPDSPSRWDSCTSLLKGPEDASGIPPLEPSS
jgi:hypothetical protein